MIAHFDGAAYKPAASSGSFMTIVGHPRAFSNRSSSHRTISRETRGGKLASEPVNSDGRTRADTEKEVWGPEAECKKPGNVMNREESSNSQHQSQALKGAQTTLV
jgi:hypothetical protein